MRKNIGAAKASPNRGAYALDDEPSWGHFAYPTIWRVTDDATAYPKWLTEVYGAGNVPNRDRWVTYNDIRAKLPTWKVKDFDAGPFMDQLTFNDAHYANFLGGLVEDANAIDPATPCGFVGGQSPGAYGGHDYARLMRKVQFLEAYDMGSSQAVIRSFNPKNALPMVTSLFHKTAESDIAQVWYFLAHGNRGHIAWVEDWFDGVTPKPWHKVVAPTYRDAGQKIGPLMAGAEWVHDGVAVYYSQPSIQLGWVLDAEAHGSSWPNRNNDHKLASASHVRHAWENMLRDAGLQYTYLSYVDVIQKGVPAEYKVLILPACLALSDAEARQIRAFCERGGTVVADYLPGVWDQHGKGRAAGGVLDAMFGVPHSPDLRASDLFGGKLWVEVDQEKNYGWKAYKEYLTHENTCFRDPSGYHRAVRAMPVDHAQPCGKGTAVLMNLSPQWYNAFRVVGPVPAAKREVFMKHVTAAGVVLRVRLKDAPDAAFGYEVTYWSKPATGATPARTVVFLGLNAEVGDALSGTNAEGIKTATLPVTLQFAAAVKGVRNERTGQALGDGREFAVEWKQNEAVVLSHDTP